MAKKKQVRVPGFKAVSVLGRGTQGVVFKGIDSKTRASVAIKVLSPKWAKIAEFKERFLRESSAALSLDHPNIVKGIKSGEAEGLLYYVMEFAEGASLHDVLGKTGTLPEKRILTLGIQTADALAYAHENNLIHRDVKPGNIIVAPDGSVKLLDLGLAKETASEKELTVAGSVFGTPNYISPEAVHDSKAVDARSDIYSLGATLYETGAGRPPFKGANAVLIMDQVCNQQPVPLRELNPEISAGLEAVIKRAMDKKPAKRYAKALHLKNDLERVNAGTPPIALKNASPDGRRPSASGRRRRSGRASSRSKKPGKGIFGRLLALFGLGRR